jgi:hypothetical protein
MADDVQLDVGTGGVYSHTKERASTKHNQVMELNVGGASEDLLSLPAAAALADGVSNPTTRGLASYGYLWNGSTWDRAKGNTAGGAFVQGPAAHGAPVAGNPLLLGAYAKATAPSDVSADGDAVQLWASRAGSLHATVDNAAITGSAGSPNAGVLSVQGISAMTPLQVGNLVTNRIQWSHFSNEYSAAQTGTALVNGVSGQKFYIGRVTIATGYVASATTCTVTLWFGQSADTTYTAGTDKTIFRGQFATIPGSGLVAYPGVVIGDGDAPFIISNAYDYLRLTTAATTHPVVYVMVDYVLV